MEIEEIGPRKDIAKYLVANGLTGAGAEVGVLRGFFSRDILQQWPGTLYLVDSWRCLPDLMDINNKDHRVHLDNWAVTFQNVYEFQERVVVIRDLSTRAASLIRDQSLDFVYLDAGHNYDSVIADLEAWRPKVKPGGLLCGDDYLDGVLMYEGATIFEVKRAVDDYATRNQIAVLSTNNGYNEFPQWYIKC
jgi:hypothetical protein